MTIALLIIAIVVVALVVWQVVSTVRNPRVRMIQWKNKERWIRLYPNFGFNLFGFRWSRHWGRR